MIDFREYLIQLQSAENTQSAFQVYEEYVHQLGFDGVLYAFFPLLMMNPEVKNINPAYYASDSYSKEYLKHYVGSNYYQQDYALKQMALGAQTAIFWWDSAPLMTRKEQEVIKVAKEYGLEDGFVLPMGTKSEGIAGASVISQNKDRSAFERLKEKSLTDLKIITQIFHEHVSCHHKLYAPFIFPLLERLSPTEQVVLRQALKNIQQNEHMSVSIKKLSSKTGFGEKTCENSLTKIKKKLGLKSTNQLIYNAGVLQFLEVFEELDKQKKQPKN